MRGVKYHTLIAMIVFSAGIANLQCSNAAASVYLVSTVAGNNSQSFSGDGGAATSAGLNTPDGVTMDGAGNLYIADSNNGRVRKVDAVTHIISTIAGNGGTFYSGENIAATSATFGSSSPEGVYSDTAGNIYATDSSNRVRLISTNGIINTVAGNGQPFFSITDVGDGNLATNATVFTPSAAILDLNGSLLIADRGNARIRKVTGGIISTIAGIGGQNGNGYSGDGGPATQATFGNGGTMDIAIDVSNNIYIADTGNSVIRKITASTGIITTVAGHTLPYSGSVTPAGGFSGDTGQATAATLNAPTGIAVDAAGNIFIADNMNNRIRRVDAATGIIETIAGGGTDTSDGVAATTASVLAPYRVLADGMGNVYFSQANLVRKLTPAALPVFTSPSTLNAVDGQPVNFTLTATGALPITFNTTSILPATLTLSGAVITGIPDSSVVGSNPVTITATNVAGTVSQTLTIVVAAAKPAITSAPSANTTAGSAFTYVITATGTRPLTFSTGTLPNGLTLSGHTISGTFTDAGTFMIPLTVTNASGTDSQTLVVTVSPSGSGGDPNAIQLTSPAAASAQLGAPFSYTAAATSPIPVAVAIDTSLLPLPDGLSVVNGNQIGGATTKAGDFPFQVAASTSASSSDLFAVIFSDNDAALADADSQLYTSTITAPVTNDKAGFINKMSVALNFAKPASDSIVMSGTLPIPSGFVLSGQPLFIDIGGIAAAIKFDAKGKAISAGGAAPVSLALRIKQTNGKVSAQTAPFSLRLRKGSFGRLTETSGLTNADASHDIKTVRVFAVFNNTLFTDLIALDYSATAGKSGAGKRD